MAVSTIAVASLLLLLLMKRSSKKVQTNNKSDGIKKGGIGSRVIIVYVIGNLLSQGSHISKIVHQQVSENV